MKCFENCAHPPFPNNRISMFIERFCTRSLILVSMTGEPGAAPSSPASPSGLKK